MTLAEFNASLSGNEPPTGLNLALAAMWWDAKGDWNAAHEHAQRDEGNAACDWVHAYLHRKEGDIANAGYWYRQAGKPAGGGPLEREWAEIVKRLLQAEHEGRAP